MLRVEYQSMNKNELSALHQELQAKYDEFQAMGLKLNMARGKPGVDQLDLSMPMLDVLSSTANLMASTGEDCRNYGMADGLPEMQALFGQLLCMPAEQVIVGGNSSLNMMFDTISCAMTHGFAGCEPWSRQEKVKFLCPAPGYDRHFGITQYFGVEMITIPMTSTGPDMDMVEELVNNDPTVKGIWCIPKYSNPTGITYSDETVRRFASLKPAAKDFRIFWDNAYCVHDLTDTPDNLLDLYAECLERGTQELPIMFASTSKITFPGAGVAAMAAGPETIQVLREHFSFQTIGPDKLNQLRHIAFLKDKYGVRGQMLRHRRILEPKFQTVLRKLDGALTGTGTASWTKPNGGYFVSVDVMPGCAKRVVQLCKEAGVTLTGAGATFPYGKDPQDSNIRVAPTYPPVSELEVAMDLFCLCVRLAACEKLLAE